MKKCWTLFLALVLIFSAGTIASSAYEGPPLTQGIDLSQENGSLIDWKLVSYDLRGQFAILCGYDGEIDSCFATNYQGAKAAGVAVGAYCHLSGNTEESVQTEMVDFITNVLAGKQFEYPIYVAVDNQEVYGAVGCQTTTDLVEMACEMLTASGYFAGVYTTVSFAKNYIDMNRLTEYTAWICQPKGDEEYTGAYDMEQYKLNGNIAGAKPIHLNYCYLDFPSIMKNGGLNGYPPPPTPPQTNTDVGFGIEATKSKTKGYKGDVNVDGMINALDALMALKIRVLKYPFSQWEKDAADVDNNQAVDAKDALEILKACVGKNSVLTQNRVETILEDVNAYAYWELLYDDFFTVGRIWHCQTYEEYQEFMALGYVNESQRNVGYKAEDLVPAFNEEFFETNGLVLWYRICGETTGSLHYSGAFVQGNRLYLDIVPYTTCVVDSQQAVDRVYGFYYQKGEVPVETVMLRSRYVGQIYTEFGLSQFEF